MPYIENAVGEFEAMDRLCAELQIESDYDFAEWLLRGIISLSQALRGANPHAQIAAANYFRERRNLCDSIWPEFRPQMNRLLSQALGRVN
jgi:hypothetical protein